MRTTSANVGEIIEVDETISLTPFITVANELVTELCIDSGYTETRLELIERWLAAHFYAIRDPRATSESVGGVGVSYQMSNGLNLNSTSYGQQVQLLDTAGSLSALNGSLGKRKTISIQYVGGGVADGTT